jgi:hypothetical protein
MPADLADDCGRIFAARSSLVKIAKSAPAAAARPTPKRRPVSFARGAHHNDQTPAGDISEHLEHLADGVPGVGVVDDDLERLAGVDAFHTSWHAWALRQTAGDVAHLHA